MPKHWTTHAEYQQFISVAVSQLNYSQRKKLTSYSDSLEKLTSLNLDPVGEHLRPYYSDTGRPALNQPEILRSFVLMMDQGITSLTNWVETLQSDDWLALMIGCTTDSLPPLGSYYDFIDRTWLQDSESQKNGLDDLLRCDKNHKLPFIDLNSKRWTPASIPDKITIDTDGTPLGQEGYRMVHDGNCPGRSRIK